MTPTVPWFMEWVIVDLNGWRLKDNAPDDVKKAFAEFMKSISMEI